MQKHLAELRKTIQKDVLPGSEKEIREEGLKTLSYLVKLLSSDEKYSEFFYEFLNDLLTSVKSFLNNVSDSLFVPAINVLIASSSKSKLAAKHILTNLKAYYQLEFTKSPSERKILISSLLPFLKSDIFTSEILEESPELFDLFLDSASFSDGEVRKISFVGLGGLVPYLNDGNRKRLYPVMVEAIKKDVHARYLIFKESVEEVEKFHFFSSFQEGMLGCF